MDNFKITLEDDVREDFTRILALNYSLNVNSTIYSLLPNNQCLRIIFTIRFLAKIYNCKFYLTLHSLNHNMLK